MRVNEACEDYKANCMFFTGSCRNQFGPFECRRCARYKDTEVLTYVSNGSPSWSIYRVLILTHPLGPKFRDICRYVETQHRGAHLDYLNYPNLLWCIMNQQDLDRVVNNLKSGRYVSIYIDTQDKKERRAVRKHFKDKYGLDLHIQTYAKLVEVVERNAYRKQGGLL